MRKTIIHYGLLICMVVFAFYKADAGDHKWWKGMGVGGAVIYNLQTEGWGIDLRANFKPNKNIRLVPQFTYFPSFNKVHEYDLGLGVELSLLRFRTYDLYLLGHGGYNAWTNYEESRIKEAQYSNWVGEIGAGLSKVIKCWRPFVEYRYNFKWKEASLRLGVLYTLGGCKGGRYGNHANYGLNGSHSIMCPAYN